MLRRTMGGTAAAAVLVLLVTTGGALAPSAAPGVQEVPRAAISLPYAQVEKGPQSVFWERICRMLKLCG